MINEGTIALTRGTGQFMLVGVGGSVLHVFSVGDSFEVCDGVCWRRVCLKSGGYRGRYVEGVDGWRARLAACARARVQQ